MGLWGVSLTRPVLKFISSFAGVSLTRPVLESIVWSFVGQGVLSDTPLAVIFLVVRVVGNFSYTPRASMSCLPFV